MQNELNRFYRILRIKWTFYDQPDKRTELEKAFYEKSSWEPPKACKEIENLIAKVQESFDKWTPPRFIKDNLSKGERKFLQNLKEKDDITYKWEDKGPSFTKMNVKQYIEAGENELENTKFYKSIDEDPSDVVKEKCNLLVNEMFTRKEISESVAIFLLSGEKNLSNFYHLLKTHKIPQDVDNPTVWLQDHGYPLRGIISGRGGPTERLASFVDYFLQPGMKQLPSFLQDTKHVLQLIEKINQHVENGEASLTGVALVTLDVESMYNNMTEELAGGASREFLEGGRGGSPEVLKVETDSILEALELCLKNNFFSFNDKIFQQTGGVGTGIKLAPPYACLGMGKFEQEAFKKDCSLLDQIMLWKRYIDDILMLFRGSKQDCENLVTWLNSLYPGVIKFKYEYSTEMVEFLDLQIMVENGKLETNLYIKPSNLQLYLDYFSNHPEPCKEGLVYGQAIRILERCSKAEDRDKHFENLRSKLQEQNYPDEIIRKKFSEARKKSRGELIHQERNKNAENENLRSARTKLSR